MEKLIHILPVIIMVESWLAAIPLAIYRQWGSALYWFSAGTLNLCAIFLIKKFG